MAGPRRRLLLANVSLANGGLERQLLLLARNLPTEWEVRLWTLEGGPYGQKVREAGIPWRCRPRRWRYDPTPALDLWRIMWSWRPEVVHAWDWMSAAAALPACLVLRIPLVDGSIRLGCVPPNFGRLRRSLPRWATLVVANSRAGLDAWGVGPEKGRVIYNAFDGSRLRADRPIPAPPGESEQPFTVVMAARMESHKDYRVVIEAARLLEHDAPGEWRFLLVGDGPDRASLAAAAEDLVAAGVVVFQDAGLEAIDAICEAEVGILMTDPATHAEGCSNSILEYMACGLPVISSDTGGCAELVRNGQEGSLIPPHDPVALASSLSELRAHPEDRGRMGAAGRARVEQEFTIAPMVAAYLQVYEEAMARRGRTR